MLTEAYSIKVHNKKTGKTTYIRCRTEKRAQVKACKLKKNPNLGVSIFKVSRE